MNGQIYLSYDEDSLATYTNTGLVRRAKKSLDDVKLQSSDTSLSFLVESFEVQLPVEGITKASCNCPAQECCKHILSSILWLQQHPEQLTDASEQASSVSAQDTQTLDSNCVTEPEQSIEIALPVHTKEKAAKKAQSLPDQTALAHSLTLDANVCLKKLRKAERILAYQIYQAWQQQTDFCTVEIEDRKISFKTSYSEAAIVYYPQTGIDGMLSDLPEKYQKACHLACIAYLFLQHAPEKWQWSDDVVNTANLTSEASQQLSHKDLVFLQELQNLCLSFMQQGLSHIAKESVLALHILNMQARAQNLPRLAAALRRLHGMLQRFLQQDIHVDEQIIFDQLSSVYAYMTALEQAHQHNSAHFAQLRGQIQRDYQQHEIAHMIPLGGEWWTTPSGARGLTLSFWDVEAQQIREVTQARANALDTTFHQQSVAETGIWGTSIQHLWKHQLKITQGKITEQGQLSPSSETHYQYLESFDQLDPKSFRQMVTGITDWQTLNQQLLPRSSLMQDNTRYQLLHIESCTPLELNEIEQQFECWVNDTQGQALQLALPIEIIHQGKINNLQYLSKHAKIIAIVVHVVRDGQQLILRPCSLILNETKGLRIFSLDFDHLSYEQRKQPFFEQLKGRIEKLLQRKQTLADAQPLDLIRLTLRQIHHLLEFYANTGRQHLDHDDQQQLQQLTQQCRDLGLDVLADMLSLSDQTLSRELLKWRHVLRSTEQLMVNLPIRAA